MIIHCFLRIDRLRLEMIELKVPSDSSPCLSFETVDTAKAKFVAQPIAVRFVVDIASGSMAALRAMVRIIENQGWSSFCSIAFNFACSWRAPAIGRAFSLFTLDRRASVNFASSTFSSNEILFAMSRSMSSTRR